MVETGNSVKVGMQPAKNPVLLYSEGPFEQSARGPAYEVEMKSSFADAGQHLIKMQSSDFKGVGLCDPRSWKDYKQKKSMLKRCHALTGGPTCWKAWGKFPGKKNTHKESLGACPIPPVPPALYGTLLRSYPSHDDPHCII